jgi:hypothetical protein
LRSGVRAFCRCGLHRSRIREPADYPWRARWQGRNEMRLMGWGLAVMRMYSDVFERRPLGLWVFIFMDMWEHRLPSARTFVGLNLVLNCRLIEFPRVVQSTCSCMLACVMGSMEGLSMELSFMPSWRTLHALWRWWSAMSWC